MPRSSRWRKSAPYRSVSACAGLVVVADRLVPHEEGEHRPHALDAAELGEALLETRAQPLELVVDSLVAQPPQHRQAGRGRERVSRQRPRLVHVSGRGEPAHDLGAPAERRERQTAADDLAQDRQVGPDPEALLRAAAARRGSP